MKTYIYQDEKSHKFWAVEQQRNELHINWGKVGTNGQSQVKSFADAAAAEKAELKLIAEKVKKGYVEQVDANAHSHDASAKKVLVTEEKASINHQAATNGLPWLADNDPIILPPNIARHALSHRLWPGEPVKKPTKPEKQNLISRLANRTYHYYKNLTFDYSSCSDEWADAISQAISLIKAQKTEIPARTMAVLTFLEICFCQGWNDETSSELLDEIVSTFGIEYATETVIFWWQIDFDFDYKDEHLTFFINYADSSKDSYRRNNDKFSLRLRKHLSLAEEEVWQNCIAKLLVALPDISLYRQPLIAILMPEIPEVAHEIVHRLHQVADVPQLEMLKLVATVPFTLEILENYQYIDVFNTYGASWSATVLREQGIAALARLASYAEEDNCGDVLKCINHPLAITALIEAADTNKRCYERLIKSAENFPSATIAALAEALVKKDDKRKHTLLVSLLNANPLLVEKLVIGLSSQAANLLQQCQQLLNSRNEDFANSEILPMVLVSPPWETQNKNNDNSPVGKYPAKIPPLPLFYQPPLWTRPKLKNSSKVLPDNALLHLGEMLRFPQEEALYPGLLQVKDACTADSLAEFAWDLFTAWLTAGAPSKESWAFTALGVLGNDDTARKLTPLIRAWPGESQHKRATVGLDILAAIGSDIALMQLNGIAQKLKFKALQERAKEKIADIAESRELTVAELEDRLAPDLGLDDNGSLLLDFGSRQFTVSFDETLKPFVRDVSGSRLKDLPKPNKSDDESQANDAVNRYKLLKKDARTVAAQQVARLESAMCLRRRWSPENFQLFLVEHPLVRHLTRRLIWGVYSAENQLLACFRVAEDNSYSTADDDLFTLPEGDISVGIPHVLEISPTDAAAFGQLFADYELLPPFRQLDRNSYALTETERNASELTRWAGRKCPSGRVMGLANKGWIKGEPQDGGWIGWMIKPLGRWSLIMEIDEGFAVGMSPAELSAEQLLSKLWLWEGKAESYGWGSNSTQEAQLSVLDAITASELINDIEALFE
ncbi:DUF4132 domain-containing protein [Escherichia coli]|uniref:DUF4132 domain-containing protein n=1 Tax=Escherichia coli TaxID=562 RepID=UPI0010225D62|nr:WGR and DUF4132 domain-containing protein [Escherichia coli]EFB1674127.1 DUF4132 domain-containing protein [Escherichia coli]HCO3831571.1 WGR and DUF4132 domain-containing protein [Escherichia coli]HCO3970451.1 WGR and DUF4132 domain-containing protein [Escherichia coli]